jgi:hypothetical protein
LDELPWLKSKRILKGLRKLGPVWHSLQQLYELFFFPNTHLQNSFMGEVVFLLSQKHELG